MFSNSFVIKFNYIILWSENTLCDIDPLGIFLGYLYYWKHSLFSLVCYVFFQEMYILLVSVLKH